MRPDDDIVETAAIGAQRHFVIGPLVQVIPGERVQLGLGQLGEVEHVHRFEQRIQAAPSIRAHRAPPARDAPIFYQERTQFQLNAWRSTSEADLNRSHAFDDENVCGMGAFSSAFFRHCKLLILRGHARIFGGSQSGPLDFSPLDSSPRMIWDCQRQSQFGLPARRRFLRELPVIRAIR
jgi:hypothetical protein